jgi:hypothetical protein
MEEARKKIDIELAGSLKGLDDANASSRAHSLSHTRARTRTCTHTHSRNKACTHHHKKNPVIAVCMYTWLQQHMCVWESRRAGSKGGGQKNKSELSKWFSKGWNAVSTHMVECTVVSVAGVGTSLMCSPSSCVALVSQVRVAMLGSEKCSTNVQQMFRCLAKCLSWTSLSVQVSF